MISKTIIDLSNLYKETKKQFRKIRLDILDEECDLEHAVVEDMQIYFAELLKIIPTSMCVSDERIKIDLLKNVSCDLPDGSQMQMDAVLISDKKYYKESMVLDNTLVDIKFLGIEQKTSAICVDTITYLCGNWKDIWAQIEKQIIEDLNYRIKQQLEKMNSKKEHLQALKDWKG